MLPPFFYVYVFTYMFYVNLFGLFGDVLKFDKIFGIIKEKTKGMTAMKINAAVFDLDGTLINSLIVWGELWKAFGEKYMGDASFVPDKEIDMALRTMTLKDACDLLCKKYNMGESGEALLDETNEFVADFYSNSVEFKDGAEEFLKILKESGTKMCVATATSSELVKYAIKRLGVDRYIDTVLSCGDIGKGKDKPDIFLLACEHLGVKPEDAWMFEDSAVALMTAKSIGMKTVGIYDAFNYGHDILKENADIYIDDGETLLKVLDA